MNDEYLSVKEVTGGYGDYIVIDGVSLRINRGQVVALLGPNGHGKIKSPICCGQDMVCSAN